MQTYIGKGIGYENRKKIMDHPVRIWTVCHLVFRLDFQPEYDQGRIVLG